MYNIAYRITTIKEYGLLMAYCIERDISVFRTYWDEREKDDRCYYVSFKDKRCYYSSSSYYIKSGYKIVEPGFWADECGRINIRRPINE